MLTFPRHPASTRTCSFCCTDSASQVVSHIDACTFLTLCLCPLTGDTHKPFAHLGKSLNLPQTAVLSLQAPGRVPLLEEEAYCWWPSFTELGERESPPTAPPLQWPKLILVLARVKTVIHNPNPTKTLTLLLRVLEHLATPSRDGTPGWKPSQIHLFGFAQGGSCAGELALAWSRQRRLSTAGAGTTREDDKGEDLGSIVTVSAPLLSHPTVSSKSGTKVLLMTRRGEQRMVGSSSWRKGFENVQEVTLASGEGMLRGQSEWMEVMRCGLHG